MSTSSLRVSRRDALTLLALVAIMLTSVMVLLAAVARPTVLVGQAAAGDAVITITSHAQVHSTGHGGCYVRTPQHYSVTLLGGGTREGSLGPGRLADDGSCAFSATLPALPGASEIIVNGGEHAIHSGAGAITLSSDDGRWVPLKAGDL